MVEPAAPVEDGQIPPSGTVIGDPPVDVAELYEPNEYFRVVALTQIARYPTPGRRIPTIDTVFEVLGTPGIHELYIDNYAFTHADPVRDLRGRSKRIRRLYALPEVLPPDPEEL